MKLNNKVALITGGASGIGNAASIKFASEGAFVYIADIDSIAGKSLEYDIRKSGCECEFLRCDVSVGRDVNNIIERIRKNSGRLDILYNNASVYLPGKDGRVTEIDEAIWDKVLSINLKSVFLFCKYGIPLMMENGGGSIINTASSAGVVGIPGCDAYTASKGATVQLTKSLAAEYGRYNVRTNCIAPAAIMTPMMRQSNPENSGFDEKSFLNLRTPLHRYGTPEEIASVALFLASDDASYMNGAIIVADGGITINGDLAYPDSK